MPIYAYRCTSCGHAKDVLQKVSDPLLTECPACGAATFAKQVTAAGFQLKGSGWYVTDFRGGNAAPGKAEGDTPKDAGGDKGGADKPAEKAEKAADKAATPTAAPAPTAAAPAAPASPTPPAASPPTSGS